MNQDVSAILKQRTNYGMALMSILFCLLGLTLIVVAANDAWLGNLKSLQTILTNLGGVLFATSLITLIWELFGKRLFLDEILHKVGISQKILSAGLVDVYATFQEFTGWASLFENCTEIDMFFSYGHSWRSNHRDKILAFLSRGKASIRVILPDPKDEDTCRELARQFATTDVDIRDKIIAAIQDFESMSQKSKNIKIFLFKGMVPHISFYKFGRTLVFSVYKHGAPRRSVPVFIVRNGGFLYSYFEDELESIISQSMKHSA